jgi:ADP-ribose pyrophosphatase
MNNKIKKLNPIAETKFISLYDAEYVNKNGDLKHWTIASRKNKEALNAQYLEGKNEKIDAVVIAALHKPSNRIVMVKQFRVPVNDYVYELPAGLIDGDESILSSAERELKEETGLKLLSICSGTKSVPMYLSAGLTDESMALVYCLCEGEPSTQFLEESEDIEILLVSQEEAKVLINKEVKFDAKVYILLQCFAVVGEKMFNLFDSQSLHK